MLSIVGTYWCGIFLDAYKYSCSYLVFAVTGLVALLLFIYIYERPRLHKLLFKSSISPKQSGEILQESAIGSIGDISSATLHKISEMSIGELLQKKLQKSKQELEFE